MRPLTASCHGDQTPDVAQVHRLQQGLTLLVEYAAHGLFQQLNPRFVVPAQAAHDPEASNIQVDTLWNGISILVDNWVSTRRVSSSVTPLTLASGHTAVWILGKGAVAAWNPDLVVNHCQGLDSALSMNTHLLSSSCEHGLAASVPNIGITPGIGFGEDTKMGRTKGMVSVHIRKIPCMGVVVSDAPSAPH